MPENKVVHEWHNLSVEEALRALGSATAGLGVAEVARRLKHYGRNELPKGQSTTALTVFLGQFKNTLIIVLIVAALLAAGVGEMVDAGVILAAVLVNVVVGYVQERKAEAALKELQRFVQYTARVIREGSEQSVQVEELVPGEVVHLSAGDRVPADARIIFCVEFEVNEATLTGESMPVEKQVGVLPTGVVLAERTNLVYLGTVVTRGEAHVVVVATGQATELGKLAGLIQQMQEEPTPLKAKIERFGRGIGIIVAVACTVLLGTGLALGYPFEQMFTLAVAVAVSAVPEGLVVVLTVILALGMRRILVRHALVRRLLAAETLGSTTVICTDKTGTLTTGEMVVGQLITPFEVIHHSAQDPADGAAAEGLLKVGVLASHAYFEPSREPGVEQPVVVGTPTERALLLAAQQAGLVVAELRHAAPLVSEVPFTSERKYMLSVHTRKGEAAIAYLKGAPEVVLQAADNLANSGRQQVFTPELHTKFMHQAEELSGQGYRLLALAEQEQTSKHTPEAVTVKLEGFTFLGFVALQDPLRVGVSTTLRAAERAGIRVVMITGDHRLTAQVIAQTAGLKAEVGNVVEGKELMNMTDEELRRRITQTTVFARTVPQDKLRIISAFQSRGEVVAMTGDGVNDAPALKAADIGVALGSGSDVAKEAADLVLLDNDFSTIVAAVEEGRVIVSNIRKVVLYLISDSFAELVLIFGAFVVSTQSATGLALPLLATQILWVNFVSDTFPAIALASDPLNPAVMEQPPVGRAEPILDLPRRGLVTMLSLGKGLLALVTFLMLMGAGDNQAHARTLVFTFMALSSLVYLFSLKQLHHSLLHPLTWNNHRLLTAAGVGLLLHLVVVYTPLGQDLFHTVPLSAVDWLAVVVLSLTLVGLTEVYKYFVWIRHYRFRLAGSARAAL